MLTANEITAIENKREFLQGEIEALEETIAHCSAEYSAFGCPYIQRDLTEAETEWARRSRQLNKIDLVFFQIDTFNTVPF